MTFLLNVSTSSCGSVSVLQLQSAEIDWLNQRRNVFQWYMVIHGIKGKAKQVGLRKDRKQRSSRNLSSRNQWTVSSAAVKGNQVCFLALWHSTQDLNSQGRESAWPTWSGEGRIDNLSKSAFTVEGDSPGEYWSAFTKRRGYWVLGRQNQ